MPDMYAAGEYDLAGFTVGAVEKSELRDGGRVEAGDVLVGIASSGPHSNGHSLVRRMFERAGRPGDLDLRGLTIADVIGREHVRTPVTNAPIVSIPRFAKTN